MSEHKCHELHAMHPSPMHMHPQACFVCANKFMPNYQTLTCPECQVSLCLECVLAYTPETAFPMHLARNAESLESLRQYGNDKTCATRLYRDVNMAPVFYEYQRFYNTDEYLRLLEERVANTEHEIACIAHELQSAQNRLSSVKLELLGAAQRRRKTAKSTG